MLSARVDEVAVTILEHTPKLTNDGRSVALATYQLLADGSRVNVERIAARTGLGASQVESLLSSWPGVFRDHAGNTVGFWGLSTTELGPHRLHVDGVQLSAWCAWDTLFLPELLAGPAEVRSRSPLDGEAISLRISPDQVEHTTPRTSSSRWLRRRSRTTSSARSAIRFTFSHRWPRAGAGPPSARARS